ncbi:MAG: hypothetical protein NTY19_06830 [Planctomycetota bacterium]|nr:hypothetical protein [Planctomycetota bacterium]
MDADQFAARLRDLAPPLDHLQEQGFTVAEAIGIRRGFECILRTEVSGPVHRDPIVDLLSRYDATGLEIGLIAFASHVEDRGNKLYFGEAESDYLVIDKATGRVQVLDHAKPDHVICECAETSERFFDALIAGLDVASLGDRSLGQCVNLAGGQRYRAFYADILGWGLDADEGDQ